jgi:hypothetical protein
VTNQADAAPASGVRGVEFWYRFAAGAWTLGLNDTASPYTYSHPFAEGAGYYAFYSRAYDWAGNYEAAPAGNDTWTRRLPALTPTATATGPVGSGVAGVTITYTWSLTPTSVNLYYTTSTVSPYTWVLCGNDAPVDGSFAYTLPGPGIYYWRASAVGGGSTESSPPLATEGPETASYTVGATGKKAPATGLDVVKSGTLNVVITWTNPTASNFWDVYASTNKAAVKAPANLLGTVPDGTGTYTHVNGQTTGTTLFYLVIGRSSDTTESTYSTMGVKLHKVFTVNLAPQSNAMWLTMPQDSGYTTASSIVMELEGALVGPGLNTKINVVGKWVPTGQAPSPYLYDTDFQEWTGDDFIIGPGDGIYLSVTSSFNWVVCGVDVGTLLTFTVNLAPQSNAMWFNLPTTSTYTTASQIVMELEGALTGPGLNTKINVVGKWVPGTQAPSPYLYDTDFQEWTGDDFSIAPGDGIYISITSSFAWNPALITPIVP